MGSIDGGHQIGKLQKRVLAVMLVSVGMLAFLNGFLNPLFEPPDELHHYQFVRHLIDEKALPTQDPDGEASQSHQPPLYYLGAALLVAPIDDPGGEPQRNPFWAYYAAGEVSQDNKLQFLQPESLAFGKGGTSLVLHVLRFWSLLLTLGTVWATWLLGQLIWPDRPMKVMLMLAIGMLNPMFIYMASSANNDSMIILWGSLLIWLTAKALGDDFAWRTTLLIGLVWAASLLSKLSGLILTAPWGLTLLWVGWRKRDWRHFVSRLLVILALGATLAGWWFVRNVDLYGEPLALNVLLDVWGARTHGQRSISVLRADVTYAWTNFWGRFGYGQVPLPDLFYYFFLFVSILIVTGGVTWLVRQRARKRAVSSVWLLLGITSLAYVSGFAYFVYRNPSGANSRYIFPALPAISAIAMASLSIWFEKMRRPKHGLAWMVALLAGIAIFTVLVFLPWTYARPRIIDMETAMAKVERPATVVFDEGIRLLGTSIAQREVRDGEKLRAMACWQALAKMNRNYTLFIRLLDRHFVSLGQRDTYTGLGTYPTSFWNPGDIFCDTYPILVSSDHPAPVAADVEIGFYDLDSGQPLTILTEDGQSVDRVIVDHIKVVPERSPVVPEPQNSLNAQFIQGVNLVGYNWSVNQASRGESISVELIWQASGPLDRSYTVFAHLVDADGGMLSQDDGLPRDGLYPTSFWGDGDLIVDRRQFTLPDKAKVGATVLRVGFYLLDDLSRLPRASGAELPDSIELSGPIIMTNE